MKTKSKFRTLRACIILSYYTFIIGDFLFLPPVLIDSNLIPTRLYLVHFIGNLMIQTSTHLLRFLWVAIFIERAMATIYSKIYEKGRFEGLSFLLPFSFGSLAIAVVAARFVCKYKLLS